MSDDITIIVDSAEQRKGLPTLANKDKCPDHPEAPTEVGYGMAGGGMGVYEYCSVCGRLLGKDQEPLE